MENIVDEIIKIDKMAEEKINSADDERKKILEETATEARDMKEKLGMSAEKRIKDVLEFHQKETDKAVSTIVSNCEQKLKELDEAYSSKHEEIETSIFNSIVGGSVGIN